MRKCKVNELIKDVEVINDVLEALARGTSEEVYSAYHSLVKLYIKKKDEIAAFELAQSLEEMV